MAREIKTLLGYTVLKAGRKVDLEDETHEASISRGSFFGVTQRENRFFILDIDVKPLSLNEFEVSKAEYIKIANSGTLTLSGLDKFIGKTNLMKLYKPTGVREIDYHNNAVRSSIYFSADDSGIAIDTDSPVYKNHKNSAYNLLEVPLYVTGPNEKVALDSYRAALTRSVMSRAKVVTINPKLLKKDSNVLIVTGSAVISATSVSKSKQAPNKKSLEVMRMVSEAIDHTSLSNNYLAEYNAKGLTITNRKGNALESDILEILRFLAILGNVVRLGNRSIIVKLVGGYSEDLYFSDKMLAALESKSAYFSTPNVVFQEVFGVDSDLTLVHSKSKGSNLTIDANGSTSDYIESLVDEDDTLEPELTFTGPTDNIQQRNADLECYFTDEGPSVKFRVKFINLADSLARSEGELTSRPIRLARSEDLERKPKQSKEDSDIIASVRGAMKSILKDSQYTIHLTKSEGKLTTANIEADVLISNANLKTLLAQFVLTGHKIGGQVFRNSKLPIVSLATGVNFFLVLPVHFMQLEKVKAAHSDNLVLFNAIFGNTNYTHDSSGSAPPMGVDVQGDTVQQVHEKLKSLGNLSARIEFDASPYMPNHTKARLYYKLPSLQRVSVRELVVLSTAESKEYTEFNIGYM